MAIENVNNKTDGIFDEILPETQLRMIFRSCENKFFLGAINANSLISAAASSTATSNNRPLMANIGPFASDSLQGAIPTFREANQIPVVGYHDRSSVLAKHDFYPNFIRTIPSISTDGLVIASLITKYFGWKKVTVFSSLSDSSQASFLTFSHYAKLFKIRVLSSHTIPLSRVELSGVIRAAKGANARIFILFLDQETAKNLIEQGIEKKLFTDETQIIAGEELSTSTLSNWTTSLNASTEIAASLLRGMIGVRFHPSSPSSPLQDQFLKNWRGHRATNGRIDPTSGQTVCDQQMDSYNSSYLHQVLSPNASAPPLCAGINYSSYSSSPNLTEDLLDAMYAYDSAISVAMGLHHLLYSAHIPRPSPADLYSALIRNVSFAGLTGQVSFSTEMEGDLFDVGGRFTGIVYDIVNFVSVSSSFVPVLQWHSEEGFSACDDVRSFRIDNPCHQFEFQSKEPPTDTPPPHIKHTPPLFTLILRILSSVGLFFSLLVAVVIYSYYTRRLVKMSQPALANFKKFGIFLGFIRVLIASFDITPGTCLSLLWLEHLAFQFIFTTIAVRCWRVNLVTGSLKRTKVTDARCIRMIMASVMVMVLFLTVVSFTEDHELHTVTVTKDQKEFIQEHSCKFTSPLMPVMYAFDLLVLVAGLCFCWLIRKVGSTVSNTAALVEGQSSPLPSPSLSSPHVSALSLSGLCTTALTILVITIVLAFSNLEPVMKFFLKSLAIALLLLRILWTFESQLIYQLLAGYELDRSLILRQSELTILEMSHTFKTKIYSSPDTGTGTGTGRAEGLDPGNGILSKQFDRLSQMKTREEIIAEMDRLKAEHLLRQQELNCLGGLLFLTDQESSSRRPSQNSAPVSSPANPNLGITNDNGSGTGVGEVV
jgi:hypothetical protein